MSIPVPSRDAADLTLRRLNTAATDLGLTLKGRPLFDLDATVVGGVTVFDIVLNVWEFDEYADLATAMEQLAERVTKVVGLVQRLDQPMPARPGATPLPGFDVV